MQNTTTPAIVTHQGGMTFQGAVGVEAFRLIALRTALRMLSKGMSPGRGWTKGKALLMAAEYTGYTYKRTQIELAIQHLGEILAARKEALQQAGQIVVDDANPAQIVRLV